MAIIIIIAVIWLFGSLNITVIDFIIKDAAKQLFSSLHSIETYLSWTTYQTTTTILEHIAHYITLLNHIPFFFHTASFPSASVTATRSPFPPNRQTLIVCLFKCN